MNFHSEWSTTSLQCEGSSRAWPSHLVSSPSIKVSSKAANFSALCFCRNTSQELFRKFPLPLSHFYHFQTHCPFSSFQAAGTNTQINMSTFGILYFHSGLFLGGIATNFVMDKGLFAMIFILLQNWLELQALYGRWSLSILQYLMKCTLPAKPKAAPSVCGGWKDRELGETGLCFSMLLNSCFTVCKQDTDSSH